jgi:NADPH:quinone reductase-like Zn-dependent oxidoreductase
MQAAVVHSFDSAPRYELFHEPEPRESEVLVQVTAAGLHPIVKSLASGKHYGSTGELNFIAGLDGVGRLPDGKRVYFGGIRKPFGSMAERAAVPSSMCIPLTDGLKDETAAAIANPGMSSYAALTVRSPLKAGENVLILGATGVAGQLAVQVAKHLGAKRVVAAGRNPEALQKLKNLGADALISLNQDDAALIAAFQSEIAEHGVDVVLDYVWGKPAEAVLAAIAQKGLIHIAPRIRYLQVGSSAGPAISLPAAILRSSGLELLGSGFGSVAIDAILRSVAEFLSIAATANFHVAIQSAPLSDVERMWTSPTPGVRLVFLPA